MVQRQVSVVLFDGFELLDVFGPVELFGAAPNSFDVRFLSPDGGPVASAQGLRVVPDERYATASAADIVLVPGGRGTRPLARDPEFLSWLRGFAQDARLVTSVCTGSGLLAAAGLLDGYRATSNKRAFEWAAEQGPRAEWVREARWVEDRNRWTSSGVAAGMDMTAALIRHLLGDEAAGVITDYVELEVQRDPDTDRFARVTGPSPRDLGL